MSPAWDPKQVFWEHLEAASWSSDLIAPRIPPGQDPIWEPSWGPRSAQNLIWEPSWWPKSAQDGPKIGPQDHQNWTKRDKNAKQHRQDDPGADLGAPRTKFPPLWCPGWGRSWSPKPTKIGPKMDPKTELILEPFFHRFWAPKRTKKWSQNWPRLGPKDITSKSDF